MGRFKNLRTLIIDNNYIASLEEFPIMLNLTTLSANKNQFKDLDSLLDEILNKFPSLYNLSMMKNPMCPFAIGDEGYYKYRLKVCKRLHNIKILDGFEVTMND